MFDLKAKKVDAIVGSTTTSMREFIMQVVMAVSNAAGQDISPMIALVGV